MVEIFFGTEQIFQTNFRLINQLCMNCEVMSGRGLTDNGLSGAKEGSEQEGGE